MYSFKHITALTVLMISLSANAAGPNLGQERSAADIAAWDISIPPSGEGLPAGSGTATEGEAVYKAQCESCHGAKGEGKPAGGFGNAAWPISAILFGPPHFTLWQRCRFVFHIAKLRMTT